MNWRFLQRWSCAERLWRIQRLFEKSGPSSSPIDYQPVTILNQEAGTTGYVTFGSEPPLIVMWRAQSLWEQGTIQRLSWILNCGKKYETGMHEAGRAEHWNNLAYFWVLLVSVGWKVCVWWMHQLCRMCPTPTLLQLWWWSRRRLQIKFFMPGLDHDILSSKSCLQNEIFTTIKAAKPCWIFRTHTLLTNLGSCDQNGWTGFLSAAQPSVAWATPAAQSSLWSRDVAKYCTVADPKRLWICAPTCKCKSKILWGWGTRKIQSSGIGCRLQC